MSEGLSLRDGKGMEPEPEKRVMSMLLARPELESPALEVLEKELGALDLVSRRLPFHHTQYYAPEMGPDLLRRMVSFREPADPGSLVEFKLRAQLLEDLFRDQSGNRAINLDPGLLGLHHLVLATRKPAAHRIYLGRGVYAELTLIYRQGSFRPLPWTYPDYASEPLLGWMNRVRGIYLWQRNRGDKWRQRACSEA